MHHSLILFNREGHSFKFEFLSFLISDRNCIYNSELFISSIHDLKKLTVRTIPGGTFKPIELNLIREYPFPPTFEISGSFLEFKGIIVFFLPF